jgi:hypothetical protein
MPKFEAVINLTVELDANNSEEADKIFLGAFTDEVLSIAKDRYKIWLDVIQIEEVTE